LPQGGQGGFITVIHGLPPHAFTSYLDIWSCSPLARGTRQLGEKLVAVERGYRSASSTALAVAARWRSLQLAHAKCTDFSNALKASISACCRETT
jgi:hypothetical protein